MNDDEQLELDIPEEPLTEEGLEEDIKRNEERRQKEYDEATKGRKQKPSINRKSRTKKA